MKIKAHRHIQKPDIHQGHFNACEHLFVDIEPGRTQTISCRLPNGKHVTFGFLYYTDKPDDTEVGCVDIHTDAGVYHPSAHTVGKHHWTQHLIGFSADFGGDAFDTRRLTHRRRVTLSTLLLHPDHYKVDSNRPADAPPRFHNDYTNFSI